MSEAVAQAIAAIIGALVGAFATYRLERRAKLLTYYGHVASFTVNPTSGQPSFLVNTHAVVLRNAGKRATEHVRMSHHYLPPNVMVWPARPHTFEHVPGAADELVIPILGPGEQVTVSYLYFAPTTYDQINAGIRSDDGPAQPVTMQLQMTYSMPARALAVALAATGCLVWLSLVIWLAHLAYRYWVG